MVSTVKFFKEVLKISGFTALSLAIVPLMLYLLGVGCIALFCMIFGSGYYVRQMETKMLVNGNAETVSVYKADNKPYLLLGPYRFARNNHDFFLSVKLKLSELQQYRGAAVG